MQKTSDSMNYYSKLVLACQDEIIYTTETYLMIKKLSWENALFTLSHCRYMFIIITCHFY